MEYVVIIAGAALLFSGGFLFGALHVLGGAQKEINLWRAKAQDQTQEIDDLRNANLLQESELKGAYSLATRKRDAKGRFIK